MLRIFFMLVFSRTTSQKTQLAWQGSHWWPIWPHWPWWQTQNQCCFPWRVDHDLLWIHALSWHLSRWAGETGQSGGQVGCVHLPHLAVHFKVTKCMQHSDVLSHQLSVQPHCYGTIQAEGCVRKHLIAHCGLALKYATMLCLFQKKREGNWSQSS